MSPGYRAEFVFHGTFSSGAAGMWDHFDIGSKLSSKFMIMLMITSSRRRGHTVGYSGAFAIIDPQTVCYLDYTGSGIETVAHVKENGRLTLMFISFTAEPCILRLHGKGQVRVPLTILNKFFNLPVQ